MRGRSIIVSVLCVLPVIASFPIGLLIGNCFITYNISDSYFNEFYLADNVVFNESEIVDFYGEPLFFSVGEKGYIVETIDIGKRNNSESINAHMTSSNGKVVNCAITYDLNVEKTIEVSNTGPYSVLVVFGPNKIESYDAVINEYAQACDAYNSRVNKTRIYSIVICFCISILICGVIGLNILNKQHKKNN